MTPHASSCLERFEAIFPSADVSHIEDAGHYVIEDAHQQIIPLVRSHMQVQVD